MTEFLLATVIARSSKEDDVVSLGKFSVLFLDFFFLLFFSPFARSPLLPV